MFQDPGGADEGLDIIDRGRLLQIATFGREWRAVAWGAALALQGFQQRRFLATDVGPGAELDANIEIEPGAALDRGTEQPGVAAALQHGLQAIQQIGILTA